MNKKLYVVKNDEGKYWDTGMSPWWDDKTGSVFKRIDLALRWAKKYGGHVVTLIEEPEKVVLSKEQAEIVENARDEEFPATYISDSANANYDEELLMKAYGNGYTVEKEKKYYVKVPLVQAQGGLWFYINSDDKLESASYLQLAKKFTMDEIEHYGLQECDKTEVTDDDIR